MKKSSTRVYSHVIKISILKVRKPSSCRVLPGAEECLSMSVLVYNFLARHILEIPALPLFSNTFFGTREGGGGGVWGTSIPIVNYFGLEAGDRPGYRFPVGFFPVVGSRLWSPGEFEN